MQTAKIAKPDAKFRQEKVCAANRTGPQQYIATAWRAS
jgi:hypothetical protein